MASKGNQNLPQKKSDVQNLKTLMKLFSNALHEDIIKSVAFNCQWHLETASNILAELSDSVTNHHVDLKSKKKSTFNNVDVSVDDEKRQMKSFANIAKKNAPKPSNNPPAAARNQQRKTKKEIEFDRIKDHILTGAKVLILLRGLPGSGKTHLAELIIKSTINVDCRQFIFSTDDFFMRSGRYQFNPTLLTDAHGWNQRRVYDSMHMGISPLVVDNTNTQMWEMEPYCKFAIQFGYAVEILEPLTSWIRNPTELARRNVHNVPRDKIIAMLERFENNITPDRLFKYFNIRYLPHFHPPQPRLYPPLNRNINPLFNVPISLQKNEKLPEQPEVPIATATVKAVKKKRRGKKRQQETDSTTGSTLSKSESMHSILSDDSLEESEDLLSTASEPNEYVLVMPDKTMVYQREHTDLINFNDEETATTKYSTDLYELDKKSDGSNLEKPLQDVNKKEADSSYPKLDLCSWGLSEDTLISWEIVSGPKSKPTESIVEPQPQRSRDDPVEKIDAETLTVGNDFNLLKLNYGQVGGTKIIPSYGRNINENYVEITPRKLNKVALFDKSTTTSAEFDLKSVQNRCSKENEHFSNLLQLFPHTSREDLKEIFDKCHGDINWTVDLLLDGSNIQTDAATDYPHSDEYTSHEHTSDCACASEYETQPYVSKETQLKATNEEAQKSSNIEQSDWIKPSHKPKPVISQDALELKKQIEEQFRIDDAYYSPSLRSLVKKRRGEDPEPTTSKEELITDDEDEEDELNFDSSSEDELIEMNVGADFVEQLEKTVGDSDLCYPKGFHPVMHLPTSLIRQLHAYWVESVFQQMENQSVIIDKMVQEDEEFARKLQEKDESELQRPPIALNLQEIMDMEIALAVYRADQQQWQKETPDDLAYRMKRQKLFETFPTLDQNTLIEILNAHNNSFDQTVEVLQASVGDDMQFRTDMNKMAKQKELIENAKKEYIKAKQSQTTTVTKPLRELWNAGDTVDTPDQSLDYYRDQAAHHLRMRQQCYEKAQEAFQKGATDIASYYSEIAKMHKQRYEEANSLAVNAFITTQSANQQRLKTLDLHFLHVREAEQALGLFIDSQLIKLRANRRVRESLFIITGRGKHSPGGVSMIKPAVKRRLAERNLQYLEMNPGLLKVHIFRHSLMTNELVERE